MNTTMGSIKDYINEKYYMLAGTGAVGAGLVSGVALAAMPGPAFLGLGGLIVSVVTGAGAVLLRPRSDEEIAQIEANARARRNETFAISAETQTQHADTSAGVKAHLLELMGKIENERIKTALGPEVVSSIADVLANTHIIQRNWNKLEGMEEAKFTVERTLTDYLPTTITTYLALPEENRTGNTEYKKDVLEQMGLLKNATARIVESMEQHKKDAFSTQNHFLKARFAENSDGKLEISSNKSSLSLE